MEKKLILASAVTFHKNQFQKDYRSKLKDKSRKLLGDNRRISLWPWDRQRFLKQDKKSTVKHMISEISLK